jgi:hypothetical protein
MGPHAGKVLCRKGHGESDQSNVCFRLGCLRRCALFVFPGIDCPVRMRSAPFFVFVDVCRFR